MNESELPDKLEELMAGYVLGNLSVEEIEELENYLEANPERFKDLTHLQEVMEVMPYALPLVDPPERVKKYIFKALKPEIEPKATKNWFSITTLIGATFLLIGFLWNNYNLREKLNLVTAEVNRQKDVIAMLQNPNTHLVSLKGKDMAPKATGRIIMTPGEPSAVMVIQNLPVLPEGKYYKLWSIAKGQKLPVASGIFNANETGTVLVKLPMSSTTDVTTLLVTVEQLNTTNNQPGPLAMTSDL